MEYINKREKTKKAIADAFAKYYREYDISQITVKMICKEAEINRSTFYAYYTDIYQLRKSIEEEIMQKLYELILSRQIELRDIDPNVVVKSLATFIQDNDGIPIVFIKRNGNDLIALSHQLFCSHMKKTGTTLTEEQKNEILISMKYHINGIIALLEFWEQNHPEKDIDALISRAARLANEGPFTVIKEIVL